MPASIRRRLLHWVIGALVEALNGIAIEGFAVEELAAVSALGAWMQVVDAPDAESDCRDILCTGMAVFRGTSNPQGCPVVCFSSGAASAASRSALRSAAFSSFFLCFSSVRARAALCRSARSRLQFGLNAIGSLLVRRVDLVPRDYIYARVRVLPVLAIDLTGQFGLAGRGSMIAMPRSMQ